MKEKSVVIEYSSLKFLLISERNHGEEEQLLQELAYRGCKQLVSLEPSDLLLDDFRDVGFQMICIPSDSYPSNLHLRQWLHLVRQVFYPSQDIEMRVNRECIALQSKFVANVAPLLVAIALIESGLECRPAVDLVRLKIPTAFSDAQLNYLMLYTPGILRNRTPQCCGGCSVL
jgi:hypothetical protein